MPQTAIPAARRKSQYSPLTDSFSIMKHAGSYMRKGGNLPIFFVVVSIFVFAMVKYGEDLKALAEYYSFGLKTQEYVPVVFSNSDHNYQSKHTSNNSSQADDKPKTEKNKKSSKEEPEAQDLHVPNSIPVVENKTSTGTSKMKANVTDDHASVGPPVIKQVVFPRVPESCDLSNGYWVFDNETHPLYREEQCEFLSSQVSCLKNGRPEDMYQKWRWQPKDCKLPKFDASLFMEKLRGKRLMFVGDSLNRNQWESMVCMAQAAVSPGKKYRERDGSRIIFIAEDYNATIEFYWAPFLVESNSDDPNIHSIRDRIIKAESIENHAVHWKDVDYLVFNTYIWWMNTLDMKVLRPMAKNWTEFDEVVRGEAYERVLRTWSNWVDQNVDPKRTTVFFMSMSPLHLQSKEWGNLGGIKCAKETLPIFNMTGVYLGTDMNMFAIAGKVARSTAKVPINFVDITAMSNYRKDAHTTVFTVQQGMLLTKEQQADMKTYADCIHWCVPGLPDTWNELLYARIISGTLRR